MLAKATQRGADAVIADLEDAVAAGAKSRARENVVSWLAEPDDTGVARWVRINSRPELLVDDLTAVTRSSLTGVYLPKVSSPDEVARVAGILDDLERDTGIEAGTIRIAPLLETASGILAVAAIAAAARVSHLSIGEADLAADLGMHPSPGAPEMNPLRTMVVVASAAAGIVPPIGPVDTAVRDLETLRLTSQALRRLGYGGRAAIHPAQIPIINSAFSPTAEEVAIARQVIERYENARLHERGVTVAADGSLIDEAVVRRARLTLTSVEGEGRDE